MNSWSLILQTLKYVSKPTRARCPLELNGGTDTSQVARELRGRIRWPLQLLGSFLLTSPNRRLCPKYLQDWARNDTTVLPLVWVNKILPHSACPAARRDAGCGMRDADASHTGTPRGGFAPFRFPNVCSRGTASSGPERTWGRANPRGDSRLAPRTMERVLESSVAKTFIELFFKCTVGCVYRAAYRMLLWKNTQYLNTFFFTFFFLFLQNGACAVILRKT